VTDFLGIDVGASGLRVFSEAESPAIAVIDAPNSSKNREQDLIDALRSLSKENPQLTASRVCLGMSGFSSLGVSAGAIAAEVRELFGAEAVITSDMVTAHYAHFGQSEGVTVVIGTGALAFGIANGKAQRIDGLGASLGDFGSAYWIGLKAMRRAVRDSELTGNSDLLTALEAQIGTAAEWPRRFARQEITEFDVASLSRKVSELSELGNRAAVEVLTEAGVVAAESAVACASAVGTKSVGYGGSVLLGSEKARESFLDVLADHDFDVSELKAPSGIGAVQIAAGVENERVKFLISQGLAHFDGHS